MTDRDGEFRLDCSRGVGSSRQYPAVRQTQCHVSFARTLRNKTPFDLACINEMVAIHSCVATLHLPTSEGHGQAAIVSVVTQGFVRRQKTCVLADKLRVDDPV